MAELGDGGEENNIESPSSTDQNQNKTEEPTSPKEDEEENEAEESEGSAIGDMKQSSSLQLMLTCIAEERRKDGISQRLISDGASFYAINIHFVIYVNNFIFLCTVIFPCKIVSLCTTNVYKIHVWFLSILTVLANDVIACDILKPRPRTVT